MSVFKESVHRNIYVGGLMLLAVSLPLSVFGMSISQLIILGNFILEGDFKKKFKSVSTRKDLWIFISIFIIHLLWIFPPQDYYYALNDLKIKIPLLVFPLLVAMEKPIPERLLRNILMLFSLSVLIASFISMGILIRNNGVNIINYRELSVFISHIRFSLMVVLSIFILLYYTIIKKDLSLRRWVKVLGIFGLIWLAFFLLILKAQTGIFVFVILLYTILWYYTFRLKHWVKYLIIILLLALPAGPVYYIFQVTKKFTDIEKLDYNRIEKLTVNGNEYSFNRENNSVENGYLVWAFYCEHELAKEWSKKSKMDYFQKDKNNNQLVYTLVRYMTSKGLRKDSVGFSKMTEDDIQSVEDGIPNYLFKSDWKVYPLVYNIIWELYEYANNDSYVDGHSVAQRIVYQKTAMQIIKKHFWLGVGTGNVQYAFDKEYETQKSSLDPKWRLRAHNQFVTFFLTFGVFGFVWILFSLLFPVLKLKGYRSFLFLIFFAIVSLSFINEDTLETQAGLTFFVYFYALLLFSKEKQIVQMKQ